MAKSSTSIAERKTITSRVMKMISEADLSSGAVQRLTGVSQKTVKKILDGKELTELSTISFIEKKLRDNVKTK